MNRVNGKYFDFCCNNSAAKNSLALKEALKQRGEIIIDEPGIYRITGGNIIESHTRLIFGKGVVLCRGRAEDCRTGTYVLINRGAYSKVYDEDILVDGMCLVCDGLEVDRTEEGFIQGLIGQISFSYIKKLVVCNFNCMDVTEKNFCIQVCSFENIAFYGVKIEGKKDGIHLGRGCGFKISECSFCTYDDPIALNAKDYCTSNPQAGWISGGVIENCEERDQPETTGYFCRLLGGAWIAWQKNMKVQHSDIAVVQNSLYNVVAQPNGKEYVSLECPCHESGVQTYPDKITWNCMQSDGALYSCGCRDIVFRNIKLKKNRQVAFALAYDKDFWDRSCYPGAYPEVFTDFVFENIENINKLDMFIWAIVPCCNIKIVNCTLRSCSVHMAVLDEICGCYPEVNIVFENCVLEAPGKQMIVSNDPRRKVNVSFFSTTLKGGIVPLASKSIHMENCDFNIEFEDISVEK